MSEIYYECVRCHRISKASEWERPGTGVFKCPHCGYKVARKVRSPLVRRVKST